MDLMQFHELRRAVQRNATPGGDFDLELVAMNLSTLLEDCGVFTDVEVEFTQDRDRLVIGLCRLALTYTGQDAARALEWMWWDRLRYPFWEAHAVRVHRNHVEFEAATRMSPDGHYVTVHLVVQPAAVPQQRRAAD